jgi:hypothetical protein
MRVTLNATLATRVPKGSWLNLLGSHSSTIGSTRMSTTPRRGLAFSLASASIRYAKNGKSTSRGGNESGKRLTDHRGRNFIPFLPRQHFIPWNRKWPRIRRFMGT